MIVKEDRMVTVLMVLFVVVIAVYILVRIEVV